eukprot:Protomagalhaensia_sp_Gyna_25__1667@NODE_1869_length_1461_cov_44_116737_g1537_i0_p1_GENE_NODE_1869_length_1461_cov_44_116737_g1537_i0NODE_1869_length_1461_cov_44_116737_g1537_i0_p1_ORF_typecomplete_len382_score53_41CAP_C/PF08603_11/7_1e34TBCC/PF07986_12/1_4e06_NODE_1869_length_1461_cov_44_116737_g1537_i01211266
MDSSAEVEVVPLGASPEYPEKTVTGETPSGEYSSRSPRDDFSTIPFNDKRENENYPHPQPHAASAFRLKHAGDPQKFKPVELPASPVKSAPKGAFHSLRKSYFDAFSWKPKKSTHLKGSRSLSQDLTKDIGGAATGTDVSDDTPAIVGTSQSHAGLVKRTSRGLSKGISAQFASLFKGATSGMKRPKTSKPSDEITTDQTPPQPTSKSNMAPLDRPPKTTYLEPNRYFIENYKHLETPFLFGDEENVGMRHGILIGNCENATIHITKKVNKVELDRCKRVTLIIPAVISAIDIQQSDSCTIHILQRLPGLSISNCQSLSVYIPRENMEDLEIASHGDGSANIMVPSEEDPTDLVEHPVPFQFVHHFKGGKLVSQVSPLYTH